MVDKSLTFFGMAGEATLFGILLFLAYKMYQDRYRIGMPVLRMLLAVVFCLIVWLLTVTMRPLQLWQRIAAVGSVQYGAFLYYTAVKQMFKNEHPRPFIRYKGFWITSLAIGIIAVLDIFLRGQPVFDSADPYTPSLLFYTEAVFSYFCLAFWDFLTIKVYLESLQRNTHLVDQSRFGVCMLAFIINLLGLVVVEFGLVLAMLKHMEYRVPINSLYHVSLAMMLFLIAVSYVLPNTSFVRILRPLSFYKTFRQRRQQALLRRLHQTMVKIVPGVQLLCEPVHDLRILIEISDARQVIWSLQKRLQPITPLEEAKYLLHLMDTNTVLLAPGEYAPAPTYIKNIIKHNVIVAKQLQCLQSYV